jgi:methionyl-tRNA formyltransferase
VRIIFAGTPDVAVPSLKALLASGHEVVAVITQPPAIAGRGRKLVASPVEIYARENSIPVFNPESVNTQSMLDEIKNLNADVGAIVAYGQLLKKPVLESLKFGWVNLHFSLLPSWRGAAPVQRCIMSGDQVTGATTFLLDEGMDTGAICGQLTTDIEPEETAGQLLDRLAIDGAHLLVSTFDAIADARLSPLTQATCDVSFAPKLSVGEANIKWHHPALGIQRWIRGCTPEPGAWTTFNNSRIEIESVHLTSDCSEELVAGQLFITKSEVFVGTGSTPVRLGRVKPAGKGWMNAPDWARGLRDELREFKYVAS